MDAVLLEYKFAEGELDWLLLNRERLWRGLGRLKLREEKMKPIAGCLFVLMMAVVMPGASGAKLPASCGPEQVSAHVTKGSGAKLQGVPLEKARLVFVQQQGFCYGCSAIQIGVDGRWVGVNQGKSWFAVTVPAGDLHVCAWMKARIMALGFAGLDRRVALTDLDAKAGQTYYFETRIAADSRPRLLLEPISGDQGQFVASISKETTSKFKRKN